MSNGNHLLRSRSACIFAALLVTFFLCVQGDGIRHAAAEGAAGSMVSVTIADGVAIELVRIPPGKFEMGSPDTERGRWADEGPVHTVHIDYDFYLGKFEITQKQWVAVMGGKAPNRFSVLGDDYPATTISWADCQAFVTKLNATPKLPGMFRLPSEAEWEYACRAGTTTRFYFGDSLGADDRLQDGPAGALPGQRSDYMTFRGSELAGVFRSQQRPVGSHRPNAFGLHDMAGGALEWCQDEYHASYHGAPTDGSAWQTTAHSETSRILRGGAWSYYVRGNRSAARHGYFGRRFWYYGLRVVWVPFKRNSPEWYGTNEARWIAENMLSYQSEYGGWPKNVRPHLNPDNGEKFEGNWQATFDNDATIREMRHIARVHLAKPQPRYEKALVRGLEFILGSQYPTGGWPQRYPLGGSYGDYITFNDGVLLNLLMLLTEVAENPEFAFFDAERRARAGQAYERGLQCLLDCQVVIDGKRTLWAQQHDPVTLKPRPARRWEPMALGTRASGDAALFLMGLENPSKEIREAVEGAVAFFEKSQHHYDFVDGDVVENPESPAIWSRFYEIPSGRSVFSTGHKFGKIERKYHWNDMPRNQRGGYGWWSRNGIQVIEAYGPWKKALEGAASR